jgi:hypothetical protein
MVGSRIGSATPALLVAHFHTNRITPWYVNEEMSRVFHGTKERNFARTMPALPKQPHPVFIGNLDALKRPVYAHTQALRCEPKFRSFLMHKLV